MTILTERSRISDPTFMLSRHRPLPHKIKNFQTVQDFWNFSIHDSILELLSKVKVYFRGKRVNQSRKLGTIGVNLKLFKFKNFVHFKGSCTRDFFAKHFQRSHLWRHYYVTIIKFSTLPWKKSFYDILRYIIKLPPVETAKILQKLRKSEIPTIATPIVIAQVRSEILCVLIG